MSWRERDPKKRKVKPVEQPIYDLELESSDDSDFNPDEHKEISDDSLDSNVEAGSQGSGSGDENDSEEDSDSDEDGGGGGDDDDEDEDDEDIELDEALVSGRHIIQPMEVNQLSSPLVQKIKKKVPKRCWGCLGDRNDDFDELVECDECGVTVHEKCYGMSDSESLASADSKNPALPWFCDTCRAGVKDPPCELCPNSGGIFKETDTGKWVHLVCALYIPGLFPVDGEKLSIFKMPYAKFGAKHCILCEDERLARTGVCIECDAGMCRTYFHATCAQRAGLLQEAHLEEADSVDKFYAHCKLHSDKTLIRRRRQNYILLQERLKERNREVEEKEKEEADRIQRKFAKARSHYFEYRNSCALSFVPPTQKMSRAIITSASACRRFWRKAEQAGLDTLGMEVQEAQMASLKDIGRKWHIPAAFSVEFIAYYLDRTSRIMKMKKQLQEENEKNAQLSAEQRLIEDKFNQAQKSKNEEEEENARLKEKLEHLNQIIQGFSPRKDVVTSESLCKPPPSRNHHPLANQMGGVPTAAALKAGVGFPLGLLKDSRQDLVSRVVAPASTDPGIVLNVCGICHQSNDPHLLAHCDNCRQFYHLGCLNPPLTRMPKKTKLMGWQCSECDKESSGSDVPCLDPEAPRKLRQKTEHSSPKGRVRLKFELENKVTIKPVVDPLQVHSTVSAPAPMEEIDRTPQVITLDADTDADGEMNHADSSLEIPRAKSTKKRRREKHHLTPEVGADGSSVERKRKRKKKNFDHETWRFQEQTMHQHVPKIKIKTIPFPPSGEGQRTQTYVASAMTSDEDVSKSNTQSVQPSAPPPVQPTVQPTVARPERQSGGRRSKVEDIMTECDVCQGPGSKENLVRCDECKKCFHFHCLIPPVKKTPKIRGYSWHCEDCDTSDSD